MVCHGCVEWTELSGGPILATCVTPALPQLVAIDDCPRSARHVVKDAALDKRVYARVAEQDQRCTIIIAAGITRDLPSCASSCSIVSGVSAAAKLDVASIVAKNRPERIQ